MKLYKNLNSAYKDRNQVKALKISVKEDDFPEELLNFQNLDELYLEGNCKSFPALPPVWQSLKVLSIKWPQFTGDISSLFSLPALENLKIIDTPFKQFLLPIGFSAAPLKSLTIKDCGLTSLPEEIAMLPDLEEMNLSGNKLSRLPSSFTTLTKLKRLNLDQNSFEHFPNDIKTMPNLTHLSIDRNMFSEDEKDRIQREFHIWVS